MDVQVQLKFLGGFRAVRAPLGVVPLAWNRALNLHKTSNLMTRNHRKGKQTTGSKAVKEKEFQVA